MSLSLYMDHHVPSAVTEGLRRRGIAVITAQNDGYARREDDELLQRATGLGCLVYTQDEDFLVLAEAWQGLGREFAGVVFGRQLNTTVGAAVQDLELICLLMTPEEARNKVIFLPL